MFTTQGLPENSLSLSEKELTTTASNFETACKRRKDRPNGDYVPPGRGGYAFGFTSFLNNHHSKLSGRAAKTAPWSAASRRCFSRSSAA